MDRLTEQEVLAAFQKLGLGTDEERAKFTQFTPAYPPEDRQEFLRLDNTTQAQENAHAELA